MDLAADTQQLLHELQVHQIELEMQNAELQQSRDQLEVALEKYADLYDFAPVSYFSLTSDGTIRLANLTGTLLAGIERERLLGRRFGVLVAGPFRAAFAAFLTRVFAGHATHSIEVELLRPDQSSRIVTIEAQCLLSKEECRAVVVDITDRKQGEENVRISEIRYRRLFEAAHDGILILDPATRKITDANPFMTKMLGYPRAQLVGKELFEIGLLQDEAASQEMFRKLKRSHEVRYENLPLESRGGRHQEVEVVANLYQENGHAVIRCNIRDMHGAQGELRGGVALGARRNYRIIFDLGPMAVYSVDRRGLIKKFNQRAVELWGRKPAPRWSQPVLRFIQNVSSGRKNPAPLRVSHGRGGERQNPVVRDQEVVVGRQDAGRRSPFW